MKYFLTPLAFVAPSLLAQQQCKSDRLSKHISKVDIGPQVQVEADATTVSKDIAVFNGNVSAHYQTESVFADTLEIQRDNKIIKGSGNFIFSSPKIVIRADKGDYSLEQETGTFEQIKYWIAKNGAHGEAEELSINRQANIHSLSEATYSTCPRDDRTWNITARTIEIDENNAVGKAWGTSFQIKNVPVFYLPYFTFPLDEARKTGFLFPRLKVSNKNGFDVTTPYYINIAPNQDATIYPRLMIKKGAMIGGEYRYLLDNAQGNVSGNILYDNDTQDSRWLLRTNHTYNPYENITISSQYQRVSDKNYLKDFENDIGNENTKTLESYINATFTPSSQYTFSGEIKNNQIAHESYTENDKPYAFLPKLSGTGIWEFGNAYVKTDAEITNFYKDNVVSGWRFDNAFTAGYDYTYKQGFFNPELTMNTHSYRLTNQTGGFKAHYSQNIPTVSIDSGLTFEQGIKWLNNDATLKVQPRLFYTYTPYSNQSDIPIFDSDFRDDSYEALFAKNRFTGKDRIGDTNQLTTAVTATITDNQDTQLGSISLGKVHYIGDRKVSLHDSVDGFKSDIYVQGNVNISDNLQLNGHIGYNADINRINTSLLAIDYSPNADTQFRLAHDFNDEKNSDIDFSGFYRLNENWRALWRLHYKSQKSQFTDKLFGVEYADCCWATRVVARQQQDTDTINATPENSIALEFIFKGLGNVGNDTNTMLRNAIPRYRSLDFGQ